MELIPLAGINNVVDADAGLVKRTNEGKFVYVRDAVNGVFDSNGRWGSRASAVRVTGSDIFENLFQAADGTVYGAAGASVYTVDAQTMTKNRVLAPVGSGSTYFIDLLNSVVVSSDTVLSELVPTAGRPFSLPTPPSPTLFPSAGALPSGRYGVCYTYKRGDQEFGASEMSYFDVTTGGISASLTPLPYSGTEIAVYVTGPDGSEPRFYGSTTGQTIAITDAAHGRACATRHLMPMPAGRYLNWWRGSLLTATGDTIFRSRPLNYRLHDPRQDFIQLPETVTFVAPVDEGIWVGMESTVIFLKGTEFKELTVDYVNAVAPVPGSGTLIKSELLDDKADQSSTTAVWLAANGYCIGTSDGRLVETGAGVLKGITGATGQTVAHNRRFTTVMTKENHL